VAEGRTSREIAASVVVSPHTVRKHIEHIIEKLEVPTRSAAVARAFGPPSACRRTTGALAYVRGVECRVTSTRYIQ
jgi:predicted ArsR family transcriptional regulator